VRNRSITVLLGIRHGALLLRAELSTKVTTRILTIRNLSVREVLLPNPTSECNQSMITGASVEILTVR